MPRTLLDLATRYEHRALLRALAEAEFLRAALAEHVPGHARSASVVELDDGQHDRPHQADVDRQIAERPADVIADLLDALGG
ncbi:MAG TPA: hypothetical protein VF080_11855 [Solirubrobacteraceae bacterium]